MAAKKNVHAARSSRFRRLGALAASLTVVAACGSAATPSPIAPSSPAPSTTAQPGGSLEPQTSSPPASGAASHWEAAGTTAVFRQDAMAVGLDSGRVLVLGNGEASDGLEVPTSGEVWDPGTGAWTPIANLNKVRREFVAVALGQDRVLVAGGLNDDDPPASYSSAYIYDARPGQEGWSKTGLMVAARTGPSAALLPDGRVLVAGGYFYVHSIANRDAAPAILAAYRPGLFDVDMPPVGAALATAELFDPVTGTWSTTGPMNYARYGAKAVTLADGRVLIAGSIGGTAAIDPNAFDTAEIYDPATGRFTLVGRLPAIDRAGLEALGEPGSNPMPEYDGDLSGVGTLVATHDGGAVLIAQTRWWKHVADMTRSFQFDVGTGAWSEIGQTYVFVGEPTRVPLWSKGVRDLSGAFVARVADGRILVAGGGGPNEFDINGFNETRTTAAADLYHPATNTWSSVPPMPEPRSNGSVVSLSDGSVLLVGGHNENGDEWTALTSATRFVP